MAAEASSSTATSFGRVSPTPARAAEAPVAPADGPRSLSRTTLGENDYQALAGRSPSGPRAAGSILRLAAGPEPRGLELGPAEPFATHRHHRERVCRQDHALRRALRDP